MRIPLFIGTYSVRGSQGIYGTMFESETGHMSAPQPLLCPDTLFNPTYLTVWGDRLYATGDTGPQGAPPNEGRVVLFHIRSDLTSLERIAETPCGQGAPCHLCLFDHHRRLAAAHYKNGELFFYRLDSKGIPTLETVFRFPGRGPVSGRQEASHFHASATSPDGKWLVAADLGQDALFLFSLSGENIHFESRIACPSGSGPRHLVYSPDGRFLWVTGELDSSVLAFRQENKTLALIDHLSIRPPGFSGENYPAEIRLHPDGQTLFVSNRGADEIVILQAHESGKLTLLGRHPTVSWPRGMILSPDGRYLLAASQHQDMIAVYAVNPSAPNRLQEQDRVTGIPSPVAFAFG